MSSKEPGRLAKFISDRVDDLSNALSRRRGLPTLAAVALIAVNFICVLGDYLVNLDPTGRSLPGILWDMAMQTNCLLHIALIGGFIGVLLSEALGKG